MSVSTSTSVLPIVSVDWLRPTKQYKAIITSRLYFIVMSLSRLKSNELLGKTKSSLYRCFAPRIEGFAPRRRHEVNPAQFLLYKRND
jgi:hypothetical protein